MSQTPPRLDTSQPAELALLKALVERPSVTPADAGCQAMLAERLSALGFQIESLPFGEVSNLWATRGQHLSLIHI